MYRKENVGVVEKVISVYFIFEGCFFVCKMILEIMYKEVKDIKMVDEVFLKILVYNNFVGCFIGKEGWNLKKVE